MTREEAIKEAYGIPVTKAQHEALQILIPELAENDDEMIRKEIVKYLTNELNNVEQLTPRTNEYERWITWLSLKFRVGDTISFKSKQYTIVGIDFDNHCYDLNDDECVDFDTAHYQFTLEKQKEQNIYKSSKSEIDFADRYSKDVWEKLMSKFKAVEGYRIGCNDVSDIVLNAILNAFKWQKEQKTVECIEFDNEFKNQVSHLLASVINKEWKYDRGFIEYATQQLLGYAKHEIKPAEWSEEEQQTISFAVDWLTKMLERTDVPEAKRDIESVILGLKSLRSQPKQELRKEEIEHLYALAIFIKSKGYEDDGEFLEGVADKIKMARKETE